MLDIAVFPIEKSWSNQLIFPEDLLEEITQVTTMSTAES